MVNACAIYATERSPTGFWRAAKELIAYEEPTLSAVAVGHLDQNSFAQALDRCIERSKRPPPPAALAPPVQHPASEVKGPFVMRRRNLR
jgi:hypothetical protein